jgi:hypothetical protein
LSVVRFVPGRVDTTSSPPPRVGTMAPDYRVGHHCDRCRRPLPRPSPLLLLIFPCTGTHLRMAPVTASPLPITAFLLVCTLPLVLQGKQLQQPHAIALAHQPHEGGLPPPPPPPISPPSCSFFPVCLLGVVVVVTVLAAMEMGGGWPWRGHLLWWGGAVGMRTWVLIPSCICILPR